MRSPRVATRPGWRCLEVVDVDVSLRGVSRLRALAVIEGQVSDETPPVAAGLQKLCRAVTRELELAGATVTLIPGVGRVGVVASSGPAMTHAEELQQDAGEGPTRDACASGQPVVVTDQGSLVARWPVYAQMATACGASAVFSLPLQVGAVRLGALTLYWRSPQSPVNGDLRRALVFADVGTEFLIDHTCSAAVNGIDRDLVAALETHALVHQAQGAVMVELGVSLAEALARMRAQAHASGQCLAVLAARILDGTAASAPAPDSNH